MWRISEFLLMAHRARWLMSWWRVELQVIPTGQMSNLSPLSCTFDAVAEVVFAVFMINGDDLVVVVMGSGLMQPAGWLEMARGLTDDEPSTL